MDLYYEMEGRRIVGKTPEFLPRIGDTLVMTPYGRVRSSRWVVAAVEWTIAQEDSAAHFNRPRTIVVRLRPDTVVEESDGA